MPRCVNACVQGHMHTFLLFGFFVVKMTPAILKSLTLGRVLNLRELLAFHKDFEEGKLFRK